MARHPGAQQREEARVAEVQAQCVQGQGAALVDAVVEHRLGAGVGEHEVLREDGEAGARCDASASAVGPPDACDQSHSA